MCGEIRLCDAGDIQMASMDVDAEAASHVVSRRKHCCRRIGREHAAVELQEVIV